jgi:hypothetical protein
MELFLSMASATGGLALGLLFLWDLIGMHGAGSASRSRKLKCALKLLGALLLFHFHFELDILD